MKIRLVPIFIAVLLAPQLVSAQAKAPYDLNTQLRDAVYILDRFEEVTTGLDTNIDGCEIPSDRKTIIKGNMSSVLRRVEAETPSLNGLLKRKHASSVDLFDVYTEMFDVAYPLDELSSSFAAWGDEKLGEEKTAEELEQLGGKASLVSATIYTLLRPQIAAQESQLGSCGSKGLSAKGKDRAVQ
jgi:hypothetical protein